MPIPIQYAHTSIAQGVNKMPLVLGNILQWFQGITEPSGSRWGIFALLLAFSFLFVASSRMTNRFLERHPRVDKAIFWTGVILFAFAIAFSIIWLVNGSLDTTPAELKDINNKLDAINSTLQNMQK
jgi:hypothetical protein